jgi:hypothetical protein
VPAVPVKVDVGLAGFPKVPGPPLKIVQLPVPTEGALAVKVVVVTPHIAGPV